MTATALEVPDPEAALLGRTARSMVTAGAMLSGPQRRAIAVRVRALAEASEDAAGAKRSSNEPLDELAHRLTTAPASIRPAFIHELEQAGVPSPTYVEVLGLVSRLTAVDTFAFGLGVDPVPLPSATDDQPTAELDGDASIDGGWIPTVGPAFPPTALSLVPAELEAMLDLHDVFYLSIQDMADLDADRGLHRTQMELVAARTSLLNECFF